MLTIIDRIKKGQFWQFSGGVKPQGQKSLSNEQEIEHLPLADKLYIPVKQHVGLEGRLNVKPGDRVLKGQALSYSMNPLAVPIHAPTSGEILDICLHVSPHPSGIPEKTIIMQPDGEEEWCDLTAISDYQSLTRASLVEVICAAGISGMGGAGFPTHIKLSSAKNIEFLIINGVECEPYITADDRLMREHAWQIRQGIDVLCHILKPQHVLIAIEDNKPEAFAAMEIAFQDNSNYTLCAVETKYPTGGEKQLIQVLTGKEVPSGGLPIDIGVMMHNVGTCFAVADAILMGKPLIERVVTVTGQAVKYAQNYWVPLGTPVNHLAHTAEYLPGKQSQPRYIMGGPMMGFTLHSPDVPVVKITNCILVPSDKELPLPGEEIPCIRCGACADACPAGLLPQQLYWHSKGNEFDKAQELNLFDCIECGACAFVCPSQIPLVHYYRNAKAEIRIQQEETQKAAKAKDRFEARNARLERDKQEREEKMRQSALARAERNKSKSDIDNKLDATVPSTSATNDRVAAALARAKAKKAAQANSQVAATTPTDNATDKKSDAPPQDQKSKVAAAIARAKAKKAAQVQQDEATTTDASEQAPKAQVQKNEKVAEAIARAKARREARRLQESEANPTEQAEFELEEPNVGPEQHTSNHQPDQTLSESDASENTPGSTSKQDKIAAAVARAKAKKATRESHDDCADQQGEENNPNESKCEEPKDTQNS